MAAMEIPQAIPDLPTEFEFIPIIHKKTNQKAQKPKQHAIQSPISSNSKSKLPVKQCYSMQ